MIDIPALYAQYRDFDLLVDSRRLTDPANTLFFALPGARVDGHDFIEDLTQRGVRHFVVHADWEKVKVPTSSKYYAVDDVLATLQALAAYHRRQFQLPVLAITGSNGKTIVKDWLVSILGHHREICYSPRSYNSQIGVALSVWQLKEQHELALFEAGISQAGEMERLRNMMLPTLGIFTNIGAAHAAGFKDRTHKLAEKMTLFRTVDWLLVPDDDVTIVAEGKRQNIPMISWYYRGAELVIKNLSFSPSSIDHAKNVEGRKGMLDVDGRAKNAEGRKGILDVDDHADDADERGRLNIRSFDPSILRSFNPSILQSFNHSVTPSFPLHPATKYAAMPVVVRRNTLTAVAGGLLLGLTEKEVFRGALSLPRLDLRLEARKGKNGCTIINDTYSNDLTSLAAALQFAESQTSSPRLVLILSDLPETSLPAEVLYQQVAQLLQGRVHELIGIGREITRVATYLPKVVCSFYPDTATLGTLLPQLNFREATILLKGARSFALERLVEKLTQRKHRTELTIDLTALEHNLGVYRDQLGEGVKMAVMVKASAYGSGSIPVARLLANQGVDFLVVAYTDEGISLREAGIDRRIMVLNPEFDELSLLQQFALEPVVADWSFLRALYPERELPIHLEFDTGMHRLGFSTADLTPLLAHLKATPHLKVSSVFTHLAASEASEHDVFTQWQIDTFAAITQQMEAAGLALPIRHILNTNGISRFPAAQLDMVRLGIGLYGIGDQQLQQELSTVLSLKAKINGIKQIAAGETVGYGRTVTLQRSSKIGVLSMGYADGLPRSAGYGRFKVWVRGTLAPILGAVCMDMCMVDLTEIPDVQAGDEAIIFGAEYPIEHLAKAAGTIPYEILTGIGERVHRVYRGE